MALIACDGDPPVIRPEPPPRSVVIAEPRAISDAAAFALVPTGEGALLVWGARDGVRAIPLGPLGEPAGAELELDEEERAITEIDATASGRRVAVAWVVDDGAEAAVEATYSLDGGRSFAAPEPLGPTVRGSSGRLDMAAHEDGSLVLYHRIPEGPCVASQGTCARFTRTGVGGDPSRGMRGTEPLEVQRPCDPLVSGALWHDGTWYHAVCHADREPSTLVYAIRPAISYAAPIDLPAGCTPLGIAPLDTGVAAVTRCAGRTSATHLDAMGRPLARFDPAEPSVVCEAGRPSITLGERASLRLDGAREDLEALLPDAIAPASARAVWTGEALVVAAHAQGEVSLRRYRCVGGRFGPAP
jgi:hypothetical protein